MEEQPYTNRELNSKFATVHEKLDTIISQVTYTNGKVKKITAGLIAVSSFAVGLGIINIKYALSLFL